MKILFIKSIPIGFNLCQTFFKHLETFEVKNYEKLILKRCNETNIKILERLILFKFINNYDKTKENIQIIGMIS